jgi:catechol 2,3-dioxygenase-like lactoylglutathione lyase family enzyme
MSVTGYRHTGIVVKDLNLQLKFYKDLLGLEVYYSEIETGKFIDHLLDEKNLSPRIIKMGKDKVPIVELLDFSEKTRTGKDKLSLFRTGLTHIALTVEDLEPLYLKLKDNGVKFINPPALSENKKFRVCFCQDFEENYIELVEVIKN